MGPRRGRTKPEFVNHFDQAGKRQSRTLRPGEAWCSDTLTPRHHGTPLPKPTRRSSCLSKATYVQTTDRPHHFCELRQRWFARVPVRDTLQIKSSARVCRVLPAFNVTIPVSACKVRTAFSRLDLRHQHTSSPWIGEAFACLLQLCWLLASLSICDLMALSGS
jgi:hypothetical protein